MASSNQYSFLVDHWTLFVFSKPHAESEPHHVVAAEIRVGVIHDAAEPRRPIVGHTEARAHRAAAFVAQRTAALREVDGPAAIGVAGGSEDCMDHGLARAEPVVM